MDVLSIVADILFNISITRFVNPLWSSCSVTFVVYRPYRKVTAYIYKGNCPERLIFKLDALNFMELVLSQFLELGGLSMHGFAARRIVLDT